MPLRLEHTVLEFETRRPPAGGGAEAGRCQGVWVRLVDQDGVEGWGEAAPSAQYRETVETVLAALKLLANLLPDDLNDFEYAEAGFLAALKGDASARVAISAALHDLVGKRLALPLWKLWGLDPSHIPPSSATIGTASPEEMRADVERAAQSPALKLRLGTADDRGILEAVRRVTDKPIRVDVGGAWSVEHAVAMLPVLMDHGVELLEQPLASGELDGLAALRGEPHPLIIADESCRTAADIPRLAPYVDGIKIKLAKCGSLREALRMIQTARAHGLVVMIGSMVETSLGVTAAAHLSPLLDVVDLDGAELLKEDPFVGAAVSGGRISLPDAPGLGVRRR